MIQRNNTALLNAAENGHAECVRLLVEAGADMEVKDDDVRTYLT